MRYYDTTPSPPRVAVEQAPVARALIGPIASVSCVREVHIRAKIGAT
jgi:hypothetical protein